MFSFLFNWGLVPDLDFSTWYAGNSILILLTLAAVVGFSFYTSLAGRSLFGDSMAPGD